MNPKKVLYIGGFELPDKNAAAHRVIAVAKCLRDLHYDVSFIGITHGNDLSGSYEGFSYMALQYPRSKKDWFRYAIGSEVLKIIKRQSSDIIIAYNYPAVALARIIWYSRKRKVKVIGDITEWYQPIFWYRRFDTFLSMRYVYKHLDGIIAISKYLYEFFSPCKRMLLPPIVDKEEKKWKQVTHKSSEDKIKIVYAGNPGKKDLLCRVAHALNLLHNDRLELTIIGMSNIKFAKTYGASGYEKANISFWGRKPHQEVIRILSSSDFQIIIRENNRLCNAGFPMKFVETVMSGASVIANRFSRFLVRLH